MVSFKALLIHYIIVRGAFKLMKNQVESKIRIIPSPACTFCGEADESLEHFCNLPLHQEILGRSYKWMGNLAIEIEPLSSKDIMFGIMVVKEIYL